MPSEDSIRKNTENIGLMSQYSYLEDRSSLCVLLEENVMEDDNEDNRQDHVPPLSQEEKILLGKEIARFKKDIISSWLRNKEMKKFYKKYNISTDEVIEYIDYFLCEKILGYIINYLESDGEKNEKHIYISTKFLSFIKRKNLGIEDLLKIIIILKNRIIEFFFDQDLKIINQITQVFDKVSTDISKNYNDITIKLLNEYTNAIDSSNIISKTDIFGIITSANEEFCRLSGYTKEELVGKPHNIVRHPDMPPEIFSDLWTTIQDRRIWKGIIQNKAKDGSSYWVKATIVPILDENDQIVEYISIRTDVTELKEAYKNLTEYTEALNDTNMVVKLDKNGVIIDVNDIFSKMSCYNKTDLLGKNYVAGLIGSETGSVNDCKIPLLRKDKIQEICNHLHGHKIWRGIVKNKTRIGNFFWTSMSIVPILNLNNEILEYVIIQSDVTDLEIAKQKLRVSLSKQKELDLKKDEFLNIASHELRTPMTLIKGYISMILDGDAGEINEEVRSYLTQVSLGSQRLLHLINDMLDISKIESGKQEFIFNEVDIVSLIHETAQEAQGLFEEKKQDFIISIDCKSVMYNTDADKLKQVLFNLLGNANKFTPVGGAVKLHCKKLRNQLVISIEDSGIGIEQGDFKKIFEKFGQVKNSLTRDINGTGLGLPIVKAIITQMHGYIDVKSTVGEGSIFSIHLPITH